MNARTIAKRFDLSTSWVYWVRSRYADLIEEHKAHLGRTQADRNTGRGAA